MKPGYKQTDVGVIPEEWAVRPLCEVLIKGRLGGNYPNQLQETDYPLMKMGNISRGQMDTTKVEYIGKGVTPELQHQLHNGDVLFNTRNTLDLVGKVAIWRDELPVAYYNSNLMRLEFDPRQICSNEYANAALNANGAIGILRGLATGTTSVAAIYTRDLLGMPFIQPPLPEQSAIATALSDVDGLLGGLDRLIAKKRDLKQAAMQQLLTGQTRLPGFKGEWEVKRLDELADIRSGGTPSTSVSNFWDGNIPWCTPTDITALNGHKYLDETNRMITPLGLKASSAEMVPAHSIVMTSRATIGECAINRISVSTNQGFKNFVPFETTDVEFLYYLLQTQKPGFISLCSGSTFLEISKTQLIAYQVQLPPLAEQTAIAAVLSDMDAELAALELRRDKTRALKQGMMQELLTGRTRLV
jgi:type I restriction enzyme S subunit